MTSELKIDLSSFGYALGAYMGKCRYCKETYMGAKRSWSCETCAIKKSLEPKITRAVPDVPELVRYSAVKRYGREEVIEKDEDGEYVRHDQAAAVIAVEKQAAIDARNLLQYEKDQQWQERAMEAEAKLTQSEKPIGYVSKSFFESLKIDRFHSIAAYVLKESSERYSEALYAAPVAAINPSEPRT